MNVLLAVNSEMLPFETKAYILMGVLGILVLVCLILLIFLGTKYKKLAVLLEANENGPDLQEGLSGEREEDLEGGSDEGQGENGLPEGFSEKEAGLRNENEDPESFSGVDGLKDVNEAIERELAALRKKTGEIETMQRKSFDKIKVVRYSSSLPDGNEATSYSIGITNRDGDGIVLTGTEQRNGATALVVKSVKNGGGKIPLSSAEEFAIRRG